jgi:hypothetical protein
MSVYSHTETVGNKKCDLLNHKVTKQVGYTLTEALLELLKWRDGCTVRKREVDTWLYNIQER